MAVLDVSLAATTPAGIPVSPRNRRSTEEWEGLPLGPGAVYSALTDEVTVHVELVLVGPASWPMESNQLDLGQCFMFPAALLAPALRLPEQCGSPCH